RAFALHELLEPGGQNVEHDGGRGLVLGAEPQRLLAERAVVRAEPARGIRPLRGGQVDKRVEEVAQPLVPARAHADAPSGEPPRISDASHARAKRQSRSTVRTETPSSSAIRS